MLVVTLEAGDRIRTCLKVRGHGVHPPVPLVRRILTDGFRALAVLRGRVEIVRRALCAHNGRRAGVGANQEHPLVDDLLMDRHHDVRARDTGDDRHFLLIDELVDDLRRDLRLELIIFNQNLNRDTTQSAFVSLHHEHEGVVHVLAQRA